MNTSIILFKKSLKLTHCQLRWLKKSAAQTPTEYCLNLIKKNDYENYLCTLLLPNNLRSAAIAIRAFNIEIALIQDQVRDNNIGQMRIKFWEDALNKIYDDQPQKNPTSLELHRILKKNKLSKHYFKRLIEARFNKLYAPTFMDIETLEKYAENTVSSIYYLLLEAQNVRDINTDHFASHLGKAQGIVTLIRSVPHNAQKHFIDLPQNILMKYNVSFETVFRGTSSKELKDVIFEVSSRAKQHLNKAMSMEKQIKKESCIIFLPYIIIENYLEKLRRVDFDIFDSRLQQRNNLLPFKLFWKKLFI